MIHTVEDINLAEVANIVKMIGDLLLVWRRDKANIINRIEGAQVKAKVDIIAHKEFIKQLNKFTPDIAVISEEDPKSLSQKRPDCYWLIDPIDGTASYVNGFPGYVTQVAYLVRGNVEISAVYAPSLSLLYTAKRNKGAFLNGNRILINKKAKPQILIDNYPEPKGIAQEAYREFELNKYVECGSISLKICRIADGTADIFLKDVVVRDWDLAAPHLILQEAGGCMMDIAGSNFIYRGRYEHQGLVSSFSAEVCRQFVSWNKDKIRSK